MKMVNRKTRKVIRKSVKKAVKKHGPKIVAGLAGGIASTLATLASTEAPGTKGKQSNLRKAVNQVSDALTTAGNKKSRRRRALAEEPGKAGKHARRSSEDRSERTL